VSPRDRAGTVERLLSAGGQVFAEQGLGAATVDDVAAAAGLTKGAVYSNFDSKEELFLAVLERRYTERIEAVRRLTGGEGSTERQARNLAVDFGEYLREDPQWPLLFFEACAHALRNEPFRLAFTERNRQLRAALAELIEQRTAQLGLAPARSAHEIAAMATILANGYALERELDPEAINDELYGQLNVVFIRGLIATAT
jgi:AcrR family transcriptional regulator